MKRLKLIRLTTIPLTMNLLLKNQLRFLNQFFEVILVSSPGNDFNEVQSREGVKGLAIKMEREINLISDIKSLFKLFYLFLIEKPKIIHSNTPKSSLLSMFAGWLLRVDLRIYTIGGLRFEGVFGFKRSILIFIEKITCYFSTHILCESIGVKNKIEQFGVKGKKVYLLSPSNLNGVDTKHFDPNQYDGNKIRKKFNIPQNEFVFLFVGRIVKDKGVFELLEAFKQLCVSNSNTSLYIVGPNDKQGDDFKLFENSYANNNKVYYFDFKNDIREFLVLCDCFVLPSYREGFPNVVLEAGSMGKPVIMTDVNGYHEYLNKSNGLLTKIGDPIDLFDNMVLIKNSIGNYSPIGIRKFVVENFESTIVHGALLEFYKSQLLDLDK
jgi:glycosyltransferase involved in cell wall biosynthesis